MIITLQETFEKHRSLDTARKQSAYMRDQFPFLGLSTPLRRSLQQEIFKEHKPIDEEHLLENSLALFTLSEREYQYAAFDYLVRYQKLCTEKSLPLFENLIRHKSWWDTVDGIAAHLCGKLILRYRDLETVMQEWNQDPYLWIRRTSLLYQLQWKAQTSANTLFPLILNLAGEKDFFIRKAIGWSLREYAKTAPQPVFTFVKEHSHLLSNLSIREALKHKKDSL